MIENTLPVYLLYVLLALLPIAVLLILLLVLEWSAPEAGAAGLFTAALVGLLAFRMPLDTLAAASAKGIWDAVFILYVVWTALLLYHIAARAGAFDALRQGLMRFSRNELFLVLVFGWVFVSFLQGVTGFGTPVAMVVPLLVVLGVRRLFAVAAPLVGHAWGNILGTLALAWLATLQVIDLDPQTATAAAFQTALLLIVPIFLAGVFIAGMHSGWRGIRHALPMIVILSSVYGGVQAALTLWNPVLSNFTAVTLGFLLLLPLSRWSRYRDPLPYRDSRMMENHAAADGNDQEPVMSLPAALLPYAILMVVAVLVLVPDAVRETLGSWQVGLSFPAVTTGYGLQRPAADPYAPFAILIHPGTFLLLAALGSGLYYYWRGCYARFQPPPGRRGLLSRVVRDAVPASLAIIAFLVLSKLMDHSGQTEVLARGIAQVVPPNVYAALSPALGVLGAFMTSSNTASNILFAPVQETIAVLAGLPVATIIAAQNAGAAVGNAIAPANIVLGTGPAGILGEEGKVLRLALPYAAAATVFVGLGVLLLVLITGNGG